MRAIKNNELYVGDAGSYFSKPGPRTITGIDIFGKIISPNFIILQYLKMSINIDKLMLKIIESFIFFKYHFKMKKCLSY